MNTIDELKLTDIDDQFINTLLTLFNVDKAFSDRVKKLIALLKDLNPNMTLADLLESQIVRKLQAYFPSTSSTSLKDGYGKCPECHKLIRLRTAFPNLMKGDNHA